MKHGLAVLLLTFERFGQAVTKANEYFGWQQRTQIIRYTKLPMLVLR
jgi:hypothetical protein